MSEKQQKSKILPARGMKIPAALCAMIMTGCLFAAAMSLILLQVMTDRGLHERTALASDVMEMQMARIEEQMTKLAEDYGFAPETLTSLVDRDQVDDLNRRMIAWWTGLTSEGALEQEPDFQLGGIQEALDGDASFQAAMDNLQLYSAEETIIRKANEIVVKSSLQVRDLLLEAGVRMAGNAVDLPEILTLLKKVPTLAGLASLLMAGLIALLMSRRIQTAGQFIGGAMSATGLLCLGSLLMIRLLNLRGMIAEASALLEAQLIHLSRWLTGEMILGAIVLMAAGGLLMALARKEYQTHG